MPTVHRRSRGDRVRERVLPVFSAVFLASYSFIVLLTPRYDPLRNLLIALLVVCWAILIVDFCVRAAQTPTGSRGAFVRAHRINLAAAIFPLFGAFVLFQRLRRVPGFRGDSGNAFRSRTAARVGSFAIVFVYVIALTELAVERPAPHATIVTFGEAVWWACVTVATVGYGDFAPVTAFGRVLAGLLMAGGLIIIGTASALIVSYLEERIIRPDATGGTDSPRDPGA
jgi:voltage-gated potassium channel